MMFGVLFVMQAIADGKAIANTQPAMPDHTVSVSAPGPYCGIYCVFAAMRSVGIQINLESLLDSRYISSYTGSSVSNLVLAITDFGGYAKPLHGLSAADLCDFDSPVILHVRPPGLGNGYSHWVLFMGINGSQVSIIDPPHGAALIPMNDLLAMWDGVGISVSCVALDQATVFASSTLVRARLCAIVLLLVLLSRVLQSSSLRAINVLLFGLAALLLGFVVDAFDENGLVRNHHGVSFVTSRFVEHQVPTIDTDTLASEISASSVQLIDVRMPAAFAHSHLPGAMNMPFNLSAIARRQLDHLIDKNKCIIVYCQNTSCAWGKSVASDLYSRGYTNIAVYEGGIDEWTRFTKLKEH